MGKPIPLNQRKYKCMLNASFDDGFEDDDDEDDDDEIDDDDEDDDDWI
jgi:hypothetical protein